jgi:pyridoxine 5-phosphate synthase
VKPDQVTLVPERPNELTTEGGLDVVSHASAVHEVADALRAAGIRVSIFIDPDSRQVTVSQEVGADAIEINTGAYAAASPTDRAARLEQVRLAAHEARRAKLEVLAGHGLTYVNVRPIAAIPEIVELNIGHSIVSRAVLVGIDRAVREMMALLK